MAKAVKKAVKVEAEEVEVVDAVDGAEAAVVTDADADDDASESAVDGSVGGDVAEPTPADVAPEPVEVKPAAKLVLGMVPNPPLQAMNAAAVRAREGRSDREYQAAQRAIARMFKRRGGSV